MIKFAVAHMQSTLDAASLLQAATGPYYGLFETETSGTVCLEAALVITLKDGLIEVQACTELGETLKPCLQLQINQDAPIEQQARLTASDIFDPIRQLLQLIPSSSRLSAKAKALLGVIGYESYQYVEQLDLPQSRPVDVPDYVFIVPQQLVVLENGVLEVISYDTNQSQAEHHLRQLLEKISSLKPYSPQPLPKVAVKQNHSKQTFVEKVQLLKQEIARGDMFQCVLATRATAPMPKPFDTFCHLRQINPSPYQFYMHLDDTILLGASPEAAVTINKDQEAMSVHISPLAGTSATKGNGLLQDSKELSEHMMLVDLARNDLAQVCQIGSRFVKECAKVHRFNHINHIRSHVQGQLKAGYDCFHALKACLPMGTLSGAPKLQAVCRLQSLENENRGFYGGTVGTFCQDGTMQTAIIIRSCVVQAGMAHLHAGAGIVYDSNPEHEFQETQLKLSKLLQLIQGER